MRRQPSLSNDLVGLIQYLLIVDWTHFLQQWVVEVDVAGRVVIGEERRTRVFAVAVVVRAIALELGGRHLLGARHDELLVVAANAIVRLIRLFRSVVLYTR